MGKTVMMGFACILEMLWVSEILGRFQWPILFLGIILDFLGIFYRYL